MKPGSRLLLKLRYTRLADKISGCKGGAPSLCSTAEAAWYSLVAEAAPQVTGGSVLCGTTLTPAVMLCCNAPISRGLRCTECTRRLLRYELSKDDSDDFFFNFFGIIIIIGDCIVANIRTMTPALQPAPALHLARRHRCHGRIHVLAHCGRLALRPGP